MDLQKKRSYGGKLCFIHISISKPFIPGAIHLVRVHLHVYLLPFNSSRNQSPSILSTTLQSVMNAKLSKHMFWNCHENGLIKTIQMMPHNLYVSVCQVDFPLLWIKDYPGLFIPNPQ